MRLVRYTLDGESGVKTGLVEGDRVRESAGDIFGPYDPTGREFDLNKINLLAPCQPGKILALGLNYRDHAQEVGLTLPEEPLLFMKPPSSVIGPRAPIICPPSSRRVDFEAELAVIIGRQAKNVPLDKALDHVLGYTCLNDVTARDLQEKDGQWIRSKGFDTFCPLGPAIETELDPSDLAVTSWLNGRLQQDSRTSNLIFSVPSLIQFISGIMTLLPGDVIATGTPSGIAPLKPGDEIEIRIEGIGSLINPVMAAE